MFGPGTNTRVSIMTSWHGFHGRGTLALQTQIGKLQEWLEQVFALSQRPQVVGFTPPPRWREIRIYPKEVHRWQISLPISSARKPARF
jgi:hypothetical protein